MCRFCRANRRQDRGKHQRQKNSEVGQDRSDVLSAAAKYGEGGALIVPLSGDRDRRRSVFMWPILASLALRRCRSEVSFGVSRRFVR